MLSMNTDILHSSPTVSHSPNKLRTMNEPRKFPKYLSIFPNALSFRIESNPFSITTWAYQRPPSPPTLKRPYLYRPDYRPPGAHGHKREQ